MFKKIIRKIIRWADDEKVSMDKAQVGGLSVAPASPSFNRLNISIVTAIGGKIVEINYYNHAKSTHYEKCYIINDTEDFSEALTHIITVENLSR